MPEGDTLYRIAATLRTVLAGQRLARVEAGVPGAAALAGTRVEAVQSHGKHLYVSFEGGRVLRTHLRMTGSVHLGRPGEPSRRPPGPVRYVLATEAWEVVCVAAPEVELLTALDAERQRATLGPDPLREDFDAAEAVRRLERLGALSVGEALLTQRAIAGIGNVYKSEVLFVGRTSPFVEVGRLGAERLGALVATARRLMMANRERSERRTRGGPGPALWVYDRAGKGCLVCGRRIAVERQGADARLTYHCAHCQGA